MDDLISRQAAIDAIAKMMPQSFTPDGSHPADKEIFIAQEAFAGCIKTIEILPSAQPEKRTEERTETNTCDTISRQAAIHCLGFTWSEDAIRNLPSAKLSAAETSDKAEKNR